MTALIIGLILGYALCWAVTPANRLSESNGDDLSKLGEYGLYRTYNNYTPPKICDPGKENRTSIYGYDAYALTRDEMQALLDGKQIGFSVLDEYDLFICYEETYSEMDSSDPVP